MFVALNELGNRVYADEAEKGAIKYLCPVCGEPVTLRRGSIKRPHFAHQKDSTCYLSMDKDYKSPWHIRMQEYFPREMQEVRFVDSGTGKIHIADVYDKTNNIVIEFQHSPISEEDFLSRTIFHLSNNRRIVWVFDESKLGQTDDRGRFRKDDFMRCRYPYTDLQYRWMRQPRKFLSRGPNIYQTANSYSICVWTGEDEDVLHRIVKEDFGFEYVCFSIHDIYMKNGMNLKEFFKTDTEWVEEMPEIKETMMRIQNENLRQREELSKVYASLRRAPVSRKFHL